LECSSGDEYKEDLSTICNNKEGEDLLPGPNLYLSCDSDYTCMLCGTSGRNKELRFRCGLCSGCFHVECSAAEQRI